MRGSDIVVIKEHAPHVFRQVRRSIVSEKQLFDSFNPANNLQAIHDIDVGTGKSPSFFFFTDDSRFMLKTMKQSELDIMLDNNAQFLVDYFTHLQLYPDSSLIKILGIYSVQVQEQTPLLFYITENVVGTDVADVVRTYDLKGSVFGRETEMTAEEISSGNTGMRVLKDQNFKDYEKGVDISADQKNRVLDILRRDAEFLR